MTRVLVVQRYLPHYRLGFYKVATEKLSALGITLRLLYGREMGKLTRPGWAQKLRAASFPLRLGEMSETMVFMPGVLARLLAEQPSLLILEDLAGLPNTLQGVLYARFRRIPYLIWGLGVIPEKTPSRLRYWLGPVIGWIYRNAAGFVCYSRHAQQVYGLFQKPTYLAANASLPPPNDDEQRLITNAIESRQGVRALQLITIGTLTAQKRLDIALQALALLKPFDGCLHVVGDGPEKAALVKLAESLGIKDNVRFYGAVYDHTQKTNILSNGHLGLLPGRGGLAIQELLWHGVPVISGVADGTESDLIRDGLNGYLVQGLLSPELLAERIRRFMLLTPQQRSQMSVEALTMAVRFGNVVTMADGFTQAVRKTLGGGMSRIETEPLHSDAR